MSYYKNLVPGQYQIGDLVFGKGTTIRVQEFKVNPHDINATDYQVSRSDENRFGQDSFKPTTIEISLGVLENSLLPKFAGVIPNFWKDMPGVEDIAREWRADEIRQIWGETKVLYHCNKDGIAKMIFGRPGQYGGEHITEDSEFITCSAEFRRGDTLNYGVNEYGLILTQAAPNGNINGTVGDAPSWMKILLQGPIVSPTITFTNLYGLAAPYALHLDYTIAANEVVEVNSYPWSRRAVSSNGNNLAAKLDAATPYLDRLRFKNNAIVNVGLAGTGMTAATKALVAYRDAYLVI